MIDQPKSTFQGERGGDAYDAELLALLKGVSANSGAADRFAGEDDDAVASEPPAPAPSPPPPKPTTNINRRTLRDPNVLPPWKRKTNASAGETSSGIVVATPSPKKIEKENTPVQRNSASPQPINMNSKSTFQGERGGDAHDEELLALLRGVSAKSGAADRFAGGDAENTVEIAAAPAPPKVSSPSPSKSKRNTDELPPWKRAKAKGGLANSNDSDVLVAAKPKPVAKTESQPLSKEGIMGGAGNFEQKSTFQGERGGDAHDEELLALLRGVSAKSSSADRFSGGDDDNNDAVVEEPAAKSAPAAELEVREEKKETNKNDSLPPWKRGKAAKSSETSVDVVVTCKPPKATTPEVKLEEPALSQEAIMGGGGSFQQKSNYQGERGGDAHDEELLALLRGVSAKSSSADRFSSEDETPEQSVEVTVAAPRQPAPKKAPERRAGRETNELPPWKRGKTPQTQSKSEVIEVAVATKPEPSTISAPEEAPLSKEAIMGDAGNFEQKSTFQGERGGDAHDEELLALLRGVSAKSSADRFAGEPVEETTPQNPTSSPAKPQAPPPSVALDIPSTDDAVEDDAPIEGGRGNFQSTPSTFQGERGGDAHDPELLALLRGASSSRTNDRFAENVETTEAKEKAPEVAPAPAVEADETIIEGGRGNFKQESTFQGERGGDAHDAELLALLRGVSSSKGSSNSEAPAPAPPAPKPTVSKSVEPPSPFPSNSSSMPPPFPTSDGPQEIEVTLDDLPGKFSDKDWKVRKASYQVLKDAITERIQKGEAPGSIDANAIVPGLDELIPTLFAEKNAVALEAAMQAGTEYANACSGATSEEQATAMMHSLIRGNGLSSPRPSAAKAATALVLKIMEVGSTATSLKAAVSILVEKGLPAKKPKVVQLSASLILDAIHSFGAAHLPLSSIAAALPKVLSHTNKKIRDTGMEIVAELCRSFASKDPLESVIGKMQKSQVKDLDALLDKRADPIPTKIGLRCQAGGAKEGATSAADVFAALQAGNEELEKERFAKRPAVKLMTEISKTPYSTELQEAKWSKKVAALDMVLKCGGEKPYKLAPPSSSENYAILISEMKGLLKHTHFAVVSKAMAVLGMLAQGVGEKLYSNLRPLLPKLLQLSKDKKLTKAVSACLDAFFGNILSYEHLLDSDSIPTATNESKEKNALARTSALDFLDRCVTRGDSAGPRGSLTPSSAKDCAKLASQKLGDSDANVRKAALKILSSLQKSEIDGVQSAVNNVVEELQKSNPRAYKTLSKTATKPAAKSSIPKPSSPEPRKSSRATSTATSSRTRTGPSSKTAASSPKAKSPVKSKPATTAVNRKPARTNPPQVTDSADEGVPTYDEALAHCASLGIPQWDEPGGGDDDLGVLAGIQAAKWQSRHAAIKELVGFVTTCPVFDDRGELETFSNSVLIFVKEHTKKFKESNMNVARCILELFSAVCDLHERSQCRIAKWVAVEATALAVEKVADRKLSALSKALLLSLCVVHPPQDVMVSACACAEKLRSPLAHEEFIVWMRSFCNEFGAITIGSSMKEVVAFLITECNHKNIKVKRAASTTLGLMHVHLGPTIKAVAFSSIKNPSLRDEIEKNFEANPFDSSLASNEWPKSYILANIGSEGEGGSANGASGMGIELPKTNLISELPSDCISRMGSKDGKTAWKFRKAALEDVEKAMKNSSGLLDTSTLKPLADLLRAMRERLSDSQSNLKPLAARVIGLVLGSMEGEAQGKLGKLVYGPIMNAAMNDKRKVMNDAAVEALKKGISIPEVKGEGLNEHSLETFVVALIGELNGSEFKSVGIAGIFTFTTSFASKLPNLDKISSQRGETVGGRFAKVLVNALSSSKAEIRSAAEALLSECISNKVFSMQSAKKCMGKMVPAKQRTVGMMLAKISSSMVSSNGDVQDETTPSKPSRISSNRAPPVERVHSKSMERSTAQKKSTARTSGPRSRLGTYSKSSVKEEDEEPVEDDASHPLRGNPNGIQKSRAAMRSVTWPEYPEEPSGNSLYSGLKKAWSQIIPPSSTKKLFPDKGIRNQSDVNGACEMLRDAIKMDVADQQSVVVEQLHFLLRWSVFVMGCKESAVGLTGLLDMLSDLISYLNDRLHEFSDPEVSLFVPFLFEKASVAKGRFKDTYMDLISSIKAGNLISEKRLGPLVCVPMMENSSQAKARLMACQTCHRCVETIGLSGIGKKGLLVAAKAFSTEKLPENRAAFLDLMALLVSKMHNDINRLSKICGSSLTLKARTSIEEHMKKVPTPPKISQAKSSRPSRLSKLSPPAKLSFPPKDEYVAPSRFKDELPALDLRRALRERESPNPSPIKASALRPPSFSTTLQGKNIASSYTSQVASSSGEDDLSEGIQSGDVGLTIARSASSSSSPLGAAASLRARLMKIREKNNLGPLPTKPSETIDIPMVAATSARPVVQTNEHFFPTSAQNLDDSILSEVLDSEPFLDNFLETIRKLLEKTHKIFENDEDLLSCTDVLKNIHAAVSKQNNLAVLLSPTGVENLRVEISERASDVVGLLTRLIGFGFNCHPETLSAGISVPLLSVNIASLMAIFRSNDLATLVSVDDLTILIKEAGTALLDPRLAQSMKQGDVTLAQIDEATSTQMVRAINKLAVQAATGAARENSIQALIRLQDQLSSTSNNVDDPQFNSRLSRIVTKLSTRVIKAEESVSHPFSQSSMDMETVLCFLEDTLDSCRKSEQPEETTATKHIAKSVVTAILKARRECNSIEAEMEDLGIDPNSSALGELVASVALDLGLIDSDLVATSSEENDVASLVSAVVSAAQGPERTAAIEALKSYRAVHGDKELMKHLEDVSPAFRSYLVKELSGSPTQVSQQRSSTDDVSERIKKLRSKLNSTEVARAQATKNENPPTKALDQQERMRNLREKLNAKQAAQPTTMSTEATKDNSGEASVTFIKVQDPAAGNTVDAFRARLASAKEKQAAKKFSSGDAASPVPTTSASSRAAALRARLQAVKMQTQL